MTRRVRSASLASPARPFTGGSSRSRASVSGLFSVLANSYPHVVAGAMSALATVLGVSSILVPYQVPDRWHDHARNNGRIRARGAAGGTATEAGATLLAMATRSRDTRPSAAARGYGSRWEKARKRHLRREPLCRPCRKAGRTTAANTVDHIIPHRGNEALMWDESNWQSMCPTCHSSGKQRQEKSGAVQYRGCQTDGTPLDPNHGWNA